MLFNQNDPTLPDLMYDQNPRVVVTTLIVNADNTSIQITKSTSTLR